MCVGLPGRVDRVVEGRALVDQNGRATWCSTRIRPDLSPGDWVLVHAGLIIDRISEAQAREVAEALAALAAEAIEATQP